MKIVEKCLKCKSYDPVVHFLAYSPEDHCCGLVDDQNGKRIVRCEYFDDKTPAYIKKWKEDLAK